MTGPLRRDDPARPHRRTTHVHAVIRRRRPPRTIDEIAWQAAGGFAAAFFVWMLIRVAAAVAAGRMTL